jgi:hypothetical protein
MSKTKFLATMTGLLLLASSALSQRSSPIGTVRAALRYESGLRHGQLFDRKAINTRKKWITRGLYSLHLIELRRHNKEIAQHPDEKPSFGDGLYFGPIPETPCSRLPAEVNRQRSAVIGTTVRGTAATVKVRFYYTRKCVPGDSGRIYQFKMKRIGSRWLIDDVILDYENWTLRKELNLKY